MDNEFKLLYDNHLYINFKKCCFLTEEVVFLGYVVTVGHLKTDEAKEDAILNWPMPKNFTSVWNLNGLALENFGSIVASMLDVLERKEFK